VADPYQEQVSRVMEAARELGLEPEVGGGLIVNESLVFRALSKVLEKQGAIFTGIKEAIRDYPDLVFRFGFKKFSVDEKSVDNGFFLYVPRGVRLEEPVYTCLALARAGVLQRVYNLIVIDSEASAVGATGCLAIVPEGAHVSLEEVYVSDGASYTSVMVHNWMPGNVVSAAKSVTLMQGSAYHDIYVNNSPLKAIKFRTTIDHVGGASTSRSDHIVVARGSGEYRYETVVNLLGPGSSSEIVSRSISAGSSALNVLLTVNARGENTRGHIECKGLMLSESSSLSTTPSLNALTPHATLTHEASIGKIKREEIEYLLSKGFTEEEAVGLIVRGFLESGLEKMPAKMKRPIQAVLDQVSRAAM